MDEMTRAYIYSAEIVITRGRGRRSTHESKLFRSREDAKEYGKKFLDSDDNVSRYTIYDI